MAILSVDEILEIHKVAIHTGIALNRAVLLGGLPPSYIATLAVHDSLIDQTLADLHQMNRDTPSSDGTAPLAVWLANAAAIAGSRAERAVFVNAQQRMPPPLPSPRASGPPFARAPLERSKSPPVVALRSECTARLFISYAFEDEKYRGELDKHLAILVQNRILQPIKAGLRGALDSPRATHAAHLREAQIIIPLVSADYIASIADWDDFEEALLRHERNEARQCRACW